MPTTSRLTLPYPQLSDNADVPEDLGALANAIDVAVVYGQGLLASRPASSGGSPGIQGRIYYATDNGHLYYDMGTGWVDIGPTVVGEDSITAFELAPDSVTSVELRDSTTTDANRAVTTDHIRDSAVTNPKLGSAAVTAAKVADSLKPSAGAGASTEALRALGTEAGKAAAGTHASQHAPAGADPIDFTTVHLSGVRSSKPAASSANLGLFYFETDWQAMWRSTGSAWVRVSHYPRRCTVAQFAAISDQVDGDEILLEVDATNGVYWRFCYRAASASAYKWEFLGGPPFVSEVTTAGTISSASYNALSPSGPSLALPRAGDYDIVTDFDAQPTSAASQEDIYCMSYDIGATTAVDADRATINVSISDTHGGSAHRIRRKTGLTAVTLAAKFRKQVGGMDNGTVNWRRMSVLPVRIS